MQTIVRATCGPMEGLTADGVSVFRGIPYAAATGGPARFLPPRAVVPWTETLDCSQFGPSCPQMTVGEMLGIPMPDEAGALMGTRNVEVEMDEDCLRLNVFAPAQDSPEPVPVVVWLHGGAWSTGSGSWPLYEFTNLARNGRVVVVSVNHRVGILGFLDLSQLDPKFVDSGNAGMLDIVAALQWITDNIHGFGGDPGNVTVFGESGGGAKVATLLAMPAAQGLFHKALAMSGSMLAAQHPDDASPNTRFVLERLGATTVEDLQAADVDVLIDAEIALPDRKILGFGRRFSPVIGPSLPNDPADAIRAGSAADVTLVSGCNRDEMVAFLFTDPDLWTLDEAGLRERLDDILDDDAPTVLDRYQECQPEETPTSQYIAITTDAMFRVPQIRLAEEHISGGGESTYMYLWTWGFEDPGGVNRAPHGVDMPFFFDNIDAAPAMAGPHAGPLVAAASGALISLAHTGSPSHAGLPDWPVYTLVERSTMLLGVDSTLAQDPLGPQRACWDGIHLPGLGPRGVSRPSALDPR